ncbi:unnamed protein product [Rotaria magnacalcarata]|uniref:Uncharacterized protein n=1 Tax=Rotaria magnacalcarata TaxID=392030 RepID=A0A816SCH8_9BILA|nr:unnamed protein product [Rotaria magnacalcarata]CAF1536332.1 unnamed protein product [Rotaria magnacalcarata]CAF2086206.1 unnamed protein product [Rotaria magnacalcarata]
MIVDGHQKTVRIACKFNNCYDNTIEELGPVLVGCPKPVSKHSKTDSNGLCERHIEMVASIGNSAMRFDPSDVVTDEDCNIKLAGFDESIRSELPRRVLRHFTRIGKISKPPSGIIIN